MMERTTPMDHLSTASRSVLRVGDGRGFLVEKNGERFVVTAAHCLTRPVIVRGDQAREGAMLPPAIGAADSAERRYARLIGPLGAEPNVSVECLFVDPVSDLAVLGPVDGRELIYEARAYDEFVEPLDPLPLGSLTFTYRRHTPPVGDPFVSSVPTAESDAWLLALDGRWFRCRVSSIRGRSLWISEAEDEIAGAMSGSPVMLSSGHAIGVVSMSYGADDGAGHREGGCPLLAADLPCWLAGGLLDIPSR